MRAAILGALAAAVIVVMPDAAAAKNAKPALPFEVGANAQRDGGPVLRFNDFSGRIPGQRIKQLLRSGPVLGDRVLLTNDTAVYFPDGYIVSAKTEFHAHAPAGGVAAQQVAGPDHLVRNAKYALVDQFDDRLGPVCASRGTIRGGESSMQMRINPTGVISLVAVTPGRYDAVTGVDTKSYTVVSAMDPYFLGEQQTVSALLATCKGQPSLASN